MRSSKLSGHDGGDRRVVGPLRYAGCLGDDPMNFCQSLPLGEANADTNAVAPAPVALSSSSPGPSSSSSSRCLQLLSQHLLRLRWKRSPARRMGKIIESRSRLPARSVCRSRCALTVSNLPRAIRSVAQRSVLRRQRASKYPLKEQ